MGITLAKTAGFCFGVERAVAKADALLLEGRKVCTLGPLIHNPQFIEELEKRGVVIVNDPGEVPEDCLMLIRTHGVPKETIDMTGELGVQYYDATCPFVKKIQKIAYENSSEDTPVLIAGDKNHPEVIGIRSYCCGPALVFNSAEELQKILESDPLISQSRLVLVAQTTFSVDEFKKCLKKVNLLCTNTLIFDTICNATAQRQDEARFLSLNNDCMIVVGGRCSSNTDKLRAVCSENCRTFLVENADELRSIDFSGVCNVGITAGASTPDSIIKEVRNTMSDIINENENLTTEENAAGTTDENSAGATDDVAGEAKEINYDGMSFEEALEESLKNMNSDQKVTGTVVRVLSNEIQVDIGRKQTGYIPFEEYSADPLADPHSEVKVGDELELMIMKTNDVEGTVMLSKRRFDAVRFWDEVVVAEKDGRVLSGKVVEVINKGVLVYTNGIRVFIPASLATASRSERIEDLLNREVRFVIVEVDKRRRRAVGSIRDVLKAERKEASQKFWDEAEVGMQYTGPVVSVTDFGAFVDLGGVHGLVHRSELSWRRIKHPSDIVKVGDVIEVYIKGLDKEKQKVSLGYKKVEDNPWEILRRDYPVGTVVEVKIAGLTAFGAFGSIIPGVDGLIHISQISDKRIAQPQDAVSLGDVVKAKIIDIDFEKKRVSLSIKALIAPEEAQEETENEVAADESPVAVSIDELLARQEAENAAEEVAAVEESAQAEEFVSEDNADAPAAEKAPDGDAAE